MYSYNYLLYIYTVYTVVYIIHTVTPHNYSQNVPEFNPTEPLNSPKNLSAVEHAIKSKIPPVTSSPFTGNLSALAQLAHSGLLLAMAGVTGAVPLYNQKTEQESEAHVKYKLCNSAEVMLTQLSHCADKGEGIEVIKLYDLCVPSDRKVFNILKNK